MGCVQGDAVSEDGAYDVVHVHEPDAPAVGWAALLGSRSPLVGTFHTYNEHRYSHGLARAFGVRLVLDRLHVRIAVWRQPSGRGGASSVAGTVSSPMECRWTRIA